MRKVLLVCLDNLGDLIFTSVLAESLRHDPDIELSLWCKDYTASMAHLLPGVRQVFAADPFWDKSPGRSKGSARIFFRALGKIRRERFDQAIIASSCWRIPLFLGLAAIPQRIGLRGRKNRWALTHVVPAPQRDEPVVAALLRSFQAYLPRQVPAQTRLDPDRLPPLQLPAELHDRPYVCLHAFAGRRDRCAPWPILESLAVQLKARGYTVLWMGTPAELQELRQLQGAEANGIPVDRWARDLLTVACFIRRAAFFIGHDSGPLHLAAALGVPVLGFYLPGEPKRTLPQGRGPAVTVMRQHPGELDQAAADAGLLALMAQLKKE